MVGKAYCGIQESNKGWFVPMYNKPCGSTVAPKSQYELSDLAKYNSDFVPEFRSRVNEGKTLRLNDMLNSKDTKTSLLETALSRVEHLAGQGNYTNPTSPECTEFYRVLGTVSDEVNVQPYLQRYEKNTGYSFRPELMKY
ncbi:MAG: hypothetical protein ACOCZ6_04000 [Nanoarchaeota archaeon]